MSNEKLREEFEAWTRDRYSWHLHDDARAPEEKTLASWNGSSYGNRIVEGMWQSWQASRAAVVVELPPAPSLKPGRDTYTQLQAAQHQGQMQVVRAIEAAGVKCK